MYAKGKVVDGRFRVRTVRQATLGYIYDCRRISDKCDIVLKCITLSGTNPPNQPDIYERQKQELLNLYDIEGMHHVECFEREADGDKIFHVVMILNRRPLPNQTEDPIPQGPNPPPQRQETEGAPTVNDEENNIGGNVLPNSCCYDPVDCLIPACMCVPTAILFALPTIVLISATGGEYVPPLADILFLVGFPCVIYCGLCFVKSLNNP